MQKQKNIKQRVTRAGTFKKTKAKLFLVMRALSRGL
ncbi:hypothetical protein predicted by Glimmer/Critica [Bdellovibrio bacteriovorus HD100]|uniref:Uncharacterized protein n=1 Tax=Bdellovibrio bacteriovorus (strain ATCC 15356 / DSM 50701 / NCIMB 9529 / HD100) TaxID=264462 RepID=Q6MKY6_BDEBA|nr:hypothetical protein predicted by Glimmer/Critica [Bdellovibrio bacteriovorus HD100]